jgi:hypothetical protein
VIGDQLRRNRVDILHRHRVLGKRAHPRDLLPSGELPRVCRALRHRGRHDTGATRAGVDFDDRTASCRAARSRATAPDCSSSSCMPAPGP